MQIHEITLREAEWKPLDPKKIMATARPTKIDWGQKIPTRVGPTTPTTPNYSGGQKSVTPTVNNNQTQTAPVASTSPATTPTATADPGSNVFGQMSQQLTPKPTVSTSSTGGTTTPTAQGLVHRAGTTNPNVIAQHPETLKAQQQWDIVNQQLRKQYPGQTEQQYQQAMLKKMGYARPGVLATTPTKASTTAPTTPVAPRPPVTPRPTTTPTTTAPAPTFQSPLKQFPPITLGSGPQAQTYVNKGRGYVDSKTGKPMPPSIIKAMGI